MFGQEFMRNALLAGTAIALACAVSGWFLVLRGQVFAGDALSHVAFPGALAAAAAGVDARAGLLAATVAAAALIGVLGSRARAAQGAAAPPAAGDTEVGIAFTFILGLGLFFLTRFTLSSGGASGVEAARTLFGSIFGLGAGEARLAAAAAVAAALFMLAIARPLLFATVSPALARARGVPTRLLALAFLMSLGVVVAAAAQAVGALLLLGLLAAPAASAHRLAAGPVAGIAIAAAIALAAMWGGLALAYAIPSLPPSSAVIGIAGTVYYASRMLA